MLSELYPGSGAKFKPGDALNKAQSRLVEINEALKNGAQNPSLARYYDNLREEQTKVTEEIERLKSQT